MLLNILLIIAFLTVIKSVPQKSCNRVKIDDQWYNREVILSNMGRPYNLHVHKATNTLFFSYSMPDTYTDIDFQLFYLNLDTKEHQIIAGIKGGCAVTIDQANDEIYLGGSDGIYKFNMHTKLADFYKEKGKNIWSLYFKTNLFYISYPDQKLHIEVDGTFLRVKEFANIEVDVFHISVDNKVYFFANKTGLYTYEVETLRIHTLHEYLSVRHIVEDNEGMVYICSNFGIYTYLNTTKEVIQISDIKNLYGVAFDKDNQFIFSDAKNIVLLRRSEYGCLNETHW